MKKKILFSLFLIACIFLAGCGKGGEKKVLSDFEKKVNGSKGYHLTGELEIVNNNDTHVYDVDVSYQKDDNFRVSLKNKTNNHEQIILKNKDGVYVLTPSLNKSFKFQSEWPYNNSQAYLLQTLLKDIKNDKDRKFKEAEDSYMFTTKVNYTSNQELVSQDIYLDKKKNIKEVQVKNAEGQIMMKMTFKDVDTKANFDDKYFTLNENMASASTEDNAASVGKIEDITYPMYIPTNTQLSNQEKVTKENGERVILTFDGEKPFMLVQETAVKEEELLTIPVFGEPVILSGTVAAVSDTSVNWVQNGIEYYVVSEAMNQEELINVARSVSTVPMVK